MSTKISAAAATRREASRRADGEFGIQPHTDPGVIDVPGPDMGDVTIIREGSRTPWGSADSVSHTAPGIVHVSTSGHGGLKISNERNALIPPALRNASGWYEEDCEAHIVAMYHPDGFTRFRTGDIDEVRASGEAGVKDWFPDEYMAATGKVLTADDSWTLRGRAAAAAKEQIRNANANNLVTTGQGRGHGWVPEGYELVDVERRSTGEKRTLMVRTGFWGRNGTHSTDFPIVIDQAERPVDVTHLVDAMSQHYRDRDRPQRPTIYRIEPDYSGLTPKQAGRAEAELSQIYNLGDGKRGTIIDHWSRNGVVGKSGVYGAGDNSATYQVEFVDGRVSAVSKAVFDALTGIPDTATEVDRARFEVNRARAALRRHDQNTTSSWRDKAKHQARREELQATLAAADRTLLTAERARDMPTNQLLGQLKDAATALLADQSETGSLR